MYSEKSRDFAIIGSFFVAFLVNHPVSGSSCDNNGFHPVKRRQYFRHHVTQTMTTQTASLCRIMCYLQESCMSYNYQPTTGSCELSNSDHTKHPDDLVPSPDFDYVRRENPCDKNPCPAHQVCKPNFKEGSHSCSCPPGHEGPICNKAANCSELLSAGYTKDGVYQIDPDGQGSFPVYCDMTTDGGGWTVFQRNQKNSPVSFNRGWQEYKTGFGNLSGEFWLGLDKIHRLTKTQNTSLRVDLEDFYGNTRYAVYSSFSIADESDYYRLRVSGYSGTAGDSIATSAEPVHISNNMRFSTPDKDNDCFLDGNCAAVRKAGWWYCYCSISDLNGDDKWWTWWVSETKLSKKKSQMKLK